MSAECREVVEFIDNLAPQKLAEGYDNVGLLVGNPCKRVERLLVCLDVNMEVVREAVSWKADMIVSHHPLIFKPLKQIREDDSKGAVLYELIKNGICVYSAHTNLDVVDHGVNASLASKLGLKCLKPLKEHYIEPLYKVVVFVPEDSSEKVRKAMCDAGAGWIGNYSDCTFSARGTGTFRPLEGTNPYIGEKGRLEKTAEDRIETIVPADKLNQVIVAMLKSHPYEEAAYDVYKTEAKGRTYSLGLAGRLDEPVTFEVFIDKVKKELDTPVVRVIGKPENKITKAAVFCGSFDDDLGAVKKSGADLLVTGDIKYHTAADAAAEGLCIVDAGHFNTEKLVLPVLAGMLKDKFVNIEIVCNSVEKDPFNFY